MTLLIIIYIIFISLGLPDALLGAVWPIIHRDLGIPLHYAGFITMIVSFCTVFSAVFSARAVKRIGAYLVVTISVFLTATALILFSFSTDVIMLCLLSVPLGIGAGAIDATLNNYVALYFKARHMNWLHCFWGIGAMTGPIIMVLAFSKTDTWRTGYEIVAFIQFTLAFIVLFSRRLWKATPKEEDTKKRPAKMSELLKTKGVKHALLIFFCYCSAEWTVGVWGSSFLFTAKNIDPKNAARLVSLYYFGITAGRLLAGFMSVKISNRKMIYIGCIVSIIGTALMLTANINTQTAAFLLTGLGFAPIFPAMMHDTPVNFGKEHSGQLIGLQMAFAYIGSTFMPPVFGVLSEVVGFHAFPLFIGLWIAILALTLRLFRYSLGIKL